MSHRLIIGRTQSGKSALAKQLGSRLRIAGAEVLAFNPTLERGYARMDEFGCVASEYETDNIDELINELNDRYEKDNQKERFLIVDEAHEIPKEFSWLTTKGRHYGLNIIAVTQRGAALNPTFRTQIGIWYVFKCSGLDISMVEDETGIKIPRDHSGANLQKFDYLKISIEGVEKRNLLNELKNS